MIISLSFDSNKKEKQKEENHTNEAYPIRSPYGIKCDTLYHILFLGKTLGAEVRNPGDFAFDPCSDFSQYIMTESAVAQLPFESNGSVFHSFCVNCECIHVLII